MFVPCKIPAHFNAKPWDALLPGWLNAFINKY
jgi:hypothetical protein